jgi:hypothetical protein
MLQKLSSDDVIGSTVIPKNATEIDKIKYKLFKKILEYKLACNIRVENIVPFSQELKERKATFRKSPSSKF